MTSDRSSNKHGSGAGDDHTRNVTIIEREDDMTADDEYVERQWRCQGDDRQREDARLKLQDCTSPCTESASRDEKCGEKLTDEDADRMIKETDVDDAQQRPPGMSQGDSAGAGFRLNCGRNRGSCADQSTGARVESYVEADRSSCSQHSTGSKPEKSR